MYKKKILLIFLTFFSLTVFSQVNPKAIGLRFGGGSFGGGLEVSYQQKIKDINRIELDFGWSGSTNYSRIGISAIYHWVWNIDGGLNWYLGPGVQCWMYSYDSVYRDINKTSNNSGFGIAVGGQIGVEYNFEELDVPLLLSIDTRPMFNFVSTNAGFGYGAALAVKYLF